MVKLGRSVGNVSKDNKSMKDALANAAEGAENPKASRFSVDGIKNMTSSKGVTKTILFYLVYAHEKPQIMKYDNTTNQDICIACEIFYFFVVVCVCFVILYRRSQ
jgi:hypothetical protein